MKNRATVRVEPLGLELPVEPGETVMAAALRCGYVWPTTCHGDGTCSVCWMEVLEGDEHLPPTGDREQEGLQQFAGRRFIKNPVRLACQTTVEGDVVVQKKGVRSQDDQTSVAS